MSTNLYQNDEPKQQLNDRSDAQSPNPNSFALVNQDSINTESYSRFNAPNLVNSIPADQISTPIYAMYIPNYNFCQAPYLVDSSTISKYLQQFRVITKEDTKHNYRNINAKKRNNRRTYRKANKLAFKGKNGRKKFKAKRGDWHCVSNGCRHWNYRHRNKCNKCGEPKLFDDTSKEGSCKEDAQGQDKLLEKNTLWYCSECSFGSYSNRSNCFKCDAPRKNNDKVLTNEPTG